ncbi:hypothetical protein ACFSUK_32325 [Sphingobium scionense]
MDGEIGGTIRVAVEQQELEAPITSERDDLLKIIRNLRPTVIG